MNSDVAEGIFKNSHAVETLMKLTMKLELRGLIK